MAAITREVDMLSPPASPRVTSFTSTKRQAPSNPIPIPSRSPSQNSRHHTPIHSASSPAFTSSLAAYREYTFKPKPPRSSLSGSHPQAHQAYAARVDPTVSRLQSLSNVAAQAGKADLRTPTDSTRPNNRMSPVTTPSGSSIGGVKRSAPVQIPRSRTTHHKADDSGANPHSYGNCSFQPPCFPLPETGSLPQSLPNLSPSFPATLFGGLSADDEHVTVWEPSSGKTVAGNAAPYRRNLKSWLVAHPGWEEKADELKSSKRRSAARRSRAAADAFAALCCYPVARTLATEAARYLHALGDGEHKSEEAMMLWTNDDWVRLQDALFRLGQELHGNKPICTQVDESKWAHVTAQIGGSKMQGTVVYCAHHMLTRGIEKSRREMGMGSTFGGTSVGDGEMDGFGRRGGDSSNFGPSSLPVNMAFGGSFLEKSFRAPREPRVTVWNPSNGRTISGNAAPCRRNLETWMRQHPGWVPKEEGQLSSSRRNRSRSGGKVRPSSLPNRRSRGIGGVSFGAEPESPHFQDAIQGLLCLSRSPSVGLSPGHSLTSGGGLEAAVAKAEEDMVVFEEDEENKLGLNSSTISSSSGDLSAGEDEDEMDMDMDM